MSFARAFLEPRAGAAAEDPFAAVSRSIDRLIHAVGPQHRPAAASPETARATPCFGMPMNWALSDAERLARIRVELRDRLRRFEPRLTQVAVTAVEEDQSANRLIFTIRGRLLDGETFEISTALNLLDHREAGP